ncbi:LPS assembly lipoprotein LptE [Blastopirellula sp. JC732]|uniref:LPS assembly lipoprotein LptE n=1 Tax=Blastopirellula sediminis TaxID=2894196 RepID=A0A9X1MIH5_9BACT|nr:LPS assembly lipoprotein LptE [Blastopirellula sediminis]MCC9604335.1 LPS assembly lipoprotein LptE [Blastopirellula sediminis]MCC9626855.1 LPS assembly lipoprotein LptE [Blastopirellula sediminis]
MIDRRWILLPLLVSLLSAGCACYQIGARTLYRPDIQTVYVPMFPSESFRRGMGERLTEAVVREIEATTPYKVVSKEMADSTLSGELVTDQKAVIAENGLDEARVIQETLTVVYRWTDARGNAIRDPLSLSLSPALSAATINNSSKYVPEAGQTMAIAQEEAIRDLAVQIVRNMQAPW